MSDSGLGSFALLIVGIGQAGVAVKAAFGARNRRGLDSHSGLPNRYLSWRAKETFEAPQRRGAADWNGTTENSRSQGSGLTYS
jgi:hypothetical protein